MQLVGLAAVFAAFGVIVGAWGIAVLDGTRDRVLLAVVVVLGGATLWLVARYVRLPVDPRRTRRTSRSNGPGP